MENSPPTAPGANGPITAPPGAADPVPGAPELPAAQNWPDAKMLPDNPSAETGSAVPTTTVRSRRALKVVLRLQPSAEPGYQVLLAVGADGCDPLYRSLDADDLPAALDAVPVLVADAEERWQRAPRYPAPTLPSRAKRRGAAPGGPETATPPAAVDQLPLF